MYEPSDFVRCLYFEPHYDFEQTACKDRWAVTSLKELCCEQIVSNDFSLLQHCTDLPQYLLNVFMNFAKERNIKSAIDFLISSWQADSFCLELPADLKTWKLFYLAKDGNTVRECLSKLQDIALSIVLSVAKRTISTTIRCLDFSEIVIHSEVLNEICNIVTYQCNSFRCMNCNEIHNIDSSKIDDSCFVSCNKLSIKINCMVDNYTIKNVVAALNEAKRKSSYVELIIVGLCIENMKMYAISDGQAGVYEFFELLKLLDPERLESFVFTGFGEHFPSPGRLLEVLKPFHNLKKFHLSHSTDLLNTVENVSLLSCSLQDMHELRELCIPATFIGDKLMVLLDKLGSECLETLDISINNLSKSEFLSLSESSLVNTLRCLNISDQGIDLECLRSLLHACANLEVLMMKGCDLQLENSSSGAEDFFSILSTLQKLRYLDIALIKGANSDVVMENAHYIGKMSCLKCLRVEYSKFEYGKESYENEEDEYSSELQLTLRQLGYTSFEAIKVVFCFGHTRQDHDLIQCHF